MRNPNTDYSDRHESIWHLTTGTWNRTCGTRTSSTSAHSTSKPHTANHSQHHSERSEDEHTNPLHGDRKKLEEFLIETNMYLTINEDTYNNDSRQIIFALSLMKDGTAGSWKQSFWIQARENNNLETWDQFKSALRESFSAPDKEGDAVTKMETETMPSQTADEYIEQFKIYAAKSKVTQDRPLVEWFIKGLNTPLLDRIPNLENPLTMIQGWYTTASKMDNQWRRGRAITNSLKGGNDTKRRGLHLPDICHPPETTMQ